MSIYVSFMCSKGGVGKSTLARITANAFHRRTDHKCLLLDADPQNTLVELRALEGDTAEKKGVRLLSANPTHKDKFLEEMREVDKEYDFIFIDSPGKTTGPDMANILRVSDVVVIPMPPSTSSMVEVINFANAIYEISPDKLVLGVVNLKYSDKADRMVREFAESMPLKLLDSSLSERMDYREATTFDLIDTEQFNAYYQELKAVIFEWKYNQTKHQ